MKRSRFALALTLTLLGCGSSEGQEAADTGTPASDVMAESERVETEVSTSEYRYLELRDNETASAAVVCEETNFPGADLDRARLFADPTRQELVASLTACEWTEQPKRCPTNFAARPSDLEGTFQSDGVSGFLSLNGGAVLCELSDGAAMELGMLLAVDEVGSDDTAVEPYEVRVCADPGRQDCGPWERAVKKEQTFPAGSLLPSR